MKTKDFSEIVKRAKANDKSALEEIYRGCYAFLVFTCKPFCDNKEDIEEVVQDTFLESFNILHQLKNDAALLPWLRRIAVNKCYRKYNKGKKDKEHLVFSGDLTSLELEELNRGLLPANCLEDSELREELLDIVNALPESQKKMVHLYYYVGMSTTEIAELSDCSTGYVRKALFTARNTIKEKLQTKGIHGVAGVAFVPLGAIYFAEEAAFAAEYVVVSALPIAATTAAAAATATAATATTTAIAKIATTGAYAAACIAAVGLVAVGVYQVVQAPEYPVADIYYQPTVAIVAEPIEPQIVLSIIEEDITENFEDIIEEDIFEEAEPETQAAAPIIYQPANNVPEEVSDIDDYEPAAEAEEPAEVYEPESAEEPLPDPEPEPEPEPITDRTAEILAALGAANTEASVTEIIRQYGFTRFTSSQGSLGETLRFYSTNQGSGDILIGIREFEGSFMMRFRFFEGGAINMQRSELVLWMEL